MIETNCIICESKNFKIWGQKENQTLYQCQNCELVFFFPYPTEEFLKKKYNETYHKERGYDGNTEAGQLRKKMYVKDIEDLENVISIRGKFLDVGCAEGEFLFLLDNKWEKYGIDISATAIANSSKKSELIISTQDLSEFENNYFDVIHLRGVFEHILNPKEFVQTANKKLKMGGYLVLSNTPNIGGYVPKLFRGKYKLVLVDEHVNYFSLKTMKIGMNKFGFKIKNVKYPYFGTPYCSFVKDLIQIPLNKVLKKESPPFWGNIFTVYSEKVKYV